jgi:hypothetical protein
MYGYGAPGAVMLGPDMGQAIPAAPMEVPKALFRYGETSIWSAQRIASGTAIASASYRLFATPQSQSGQGWNASLTLAETSLKQGGAVPAGQSFDVFGIAAHIYAGGTTDTAAGEKSVTPFDDDNTINQLLNVQNNGVLSWDFVATTIDICPVVLAGAGGGAFGAVSTVANAASVGHMNNGNGSVWLYRKHPVSLPGQSVFAILLRFGSRAIDVANLSIIVKVILLGYYKTAIEVG